MKKMIIFISFIFSISIFANEDHNPYLLAITTGEPSALIDSCVNAITGDYVISKNDIIVQGVEPIIINPT